MRDNLFSAILTFSLLAGGTIAVGAEMMGGQRSGPAAPVACVTLDPVTVIGHRRTAVAEVVTLPKVTVTGRRSNWVAVESHEPAPKFE